MLRRRRKRAKHGGGRERVELPDVPAREPDDRLLALDDALTRLAAEDPLAARVVQLRHFTGASHDAVAAALGISTGTARAAYDSVQKPCLSEAAAGCCSGTSSRRRRKCVETIRLLHTTPKNNSQRAALEPFFQVAQGDLEAPSPGA